MVRYHPWTQCTRYLIGKFISHITAPGFVSHSSCFILFIHILGTALQMWENAKEVQHLSTVPVSGRSPGSSQFLVGIQCTLTGAQTRRRKWLHRNVETTTHREAQSRKSELRWHWGVWFQLNSCPGKRGCQHLHHCSSQSSDPGDPLWKAEGKGNCQIIWHKITVDAKYFITTRIEVNLLPFSVKFC